MKGLFFIFFIALIAVFSTTCNAQPTPPAEIIHKITFDALMSNPTQYNGKEICTQAVLMQGFEMNAISGAIIEELGRHTLADPQVWLENAAVTNLGCTDEDGFRFCFVIACGKFETGGSYGHLGGWNFNLSQLQFNGEAPAFIAQPVQAIQVTP